VVEVCCFAVLSASSSRNATVEIEGELDVGQRVLARLVRQNARFLGQAAHGSPFLQARSRIWNALHKSHDGSERDGRLDLQR